MTARPIAASGLSYDLAVHSGLKLDDSYRVRNGRQKVANAVADDLAYTLRLRYTGVPGLQLASSVQYQADATQATDNETVSAVLTEAHAIFEKGPFSARALWAAWSLDGDGPEAAGRDRQDGYYGEIGYRVLASVGLFARYSVADGGRTIDFPVGDLLNLAFSIGGDEHLCYVESLARIHASSGTTGITGATHLPGMPDDVVRELHADAHTAIVALTHDPKLDDMALLEALRSDAFYVGALGSSRNQAARKKRLAEHFDLTEAELARLHGPVGLRIGAKTPAEIAVSVVAQIVERKNQSEQGVKPAAGCAVSQ